MIAIPLVILSYAIVNVAFFAVLSYDEITSTQAVGLVSRITRFYCMKMVLLICRYMEMLLLERQD